MYFPLDFTEPTSKGHGACNGLCCCLILPTAVCVINPKDPWRNDLQEEKDISSSVFCGTGFLFFNLIVKVL